MTRKRAAYLVIGLVLLVAFLAAGGTLWTAAWLRGRLPAVQPIDDAIQEAGKDLAAKLASQSLFGVFKPVEDVPRETGITAPDYALQPNAHKVNTWFSIAMFDRGKDTGQPFALKCAETQRKAMMKYYRQLLARKERGLVQLDTEKLLSESTCDYIIRATWSWRNAGAKRPDGLACLKLCALRGTAGQQEVATAKLAAFTHPKITAEVEGRRCNLDRWIDLGLSAFSVSGVGLVLVLGVFLIRRRHYRSRSEHILDAATLNLREGLYVAAYERIRRYLTYCPGDADAQQLLASLPAEPRLAQQAAAERRDLEQLVQTIRTSGHFVDVTAGEGWKRKQELAKHDRRLEQAMSLYLDLKAEWQRTKELETLRGQCEREIQQLISQRRFNAAEERAKELAATDPDWNGLKLLEATVASARDKAQAYLADARRLLEARDPAAALAAADKACEHDVEADEAKCLAERIRASERGLRLVPKTVGKSLLVFANTAVTFGRAEGHVLVDNVKVSGKHLQLALADNKLVAQDLDSRNGTYYRGEKFKRLELHDGDILDMAGVCQLTLHVQRGEPASSPGALTKTVAATQAEPARQRSSRHSPISGVFVEGPEDFDAAMVVSGLRLGFTAVGIRPDASGDCRFGRVDGFITFARKGQPAQVLLDGSEINAGSVAYRVTACPPRGEAEHAQ